MPPGTCRSIASTCWLKQPEGEDVRSAFPAYVVDGSMEYRHRQFVLHVVEDRTYTMS